MNIYEKHQNLTERARLLKLQCCNLSVIRRSHNLNQAEMAATLDIAKSTYANYERGIRLTKPDVVQKIKHKYQADIYAEYLSMIWPVSDATNPSEKTHRNLNVSNVDNQSRPSCGSPNAIRCLDCGELEYVSRSYCRCNSYLFGQVEERAFKWSEDEFVRIDMEIKREKIKLNSYKLSLIISITLIVLGFLSLQFNWLSNISGFIIIGATISCLTFIPVVMIEKRIEALEASKQKLTVENYIDLGIYIEN